MKTKEQFHKWLTREGKSESTANTYTLALKLFEEQGYEYTFESICKWKEDLCKTHKPASVNLRIQSMNEFLEFNGLKFKLKPLKFALQRFVDAQLTSNQYNRLLSGLRHDNELQWWVAVRVMAGTGVRISEFLQISLSDLQTGYMDIRGKGNKYRRIWFPDKLRKDVLSVYKKEGLLLPYTDRYVRMRFKEFAVKYKIPVEVMHPHEFRAFYARNVYEKTKDIKLVQDLLGHEHVSTTMRYLRQTSQSVGNRISSIVDW